MSLSNLDLMIVLSSLVVLLGIGYVFRLRVKQSDDLVQAEGSAALAALALAGAGLCAPELVALGAAGARWGLWSAALVLVSGVPALVLLGRWITPWLRQTKSRTIAGLLGKRYNAEARTLAAALFVLSTVLMMALSLRWMAEVLRAQHLFDRFLRSHGLPTATIVPLAVLAPALVALVCVLLGGLRSTLYSRVVLFVVTLVAVLAATVSGWNNQAGTAQLHAALAGQGFNAMQAAMAVLLALLLGAAYACADFRVVQFALIKPTPSKTKSHRPENMAGRLLLPLVLAAVAAGVVAVAMRTPASQSEIHEDNGIIYHTITVVRPEAEAGQGAVPAQVEPQSGQVVRDGAGKAQLSWSMATPGLISRLPMGLMGLGVAALVASLLSGLVGGLSALNAVINADLLRLKPELEPRRLLMQRLIAVAAMLVTAELAFTLTGADPKAALPVVFLIGNLPVLAVLALGALWKGAGGMGGFAGLLAGVAAGAATHGLTLPANAVRGWAGGWLAPLCACPDLLTQLLAAAVVTVAAAVLATCAVSALSKNQPR